MLSSSSHGKGVCKEMARTEMEIWMVRVVEERDRAADRDEDEGEWRDQRYRLRDMVSRC